MSIHTISWLFIVFFMLHEFEEIICLPNFIHKNQALLELKAPKKILTNTLTLSTEQFTFAVFEEFILLSFITFIAVQSNKYEFFLATVIVYLIHLLIHLFQSIFLKKYIPGMLGGTISFFTAST